MAHSKEFEPDFSSSEKPKEIFPTPQEHWQLVREIKSFIPPTPDHVIQLPGDREDHVYNSTDQDTIIVLYDNPESISVAHGTLRVSYERSSQIIFFKLSPTLTLSFTDVNQGLPAELFELFPQAAQVRTFRVNLVEYHQDQYFDGESESDYQVLFQTALDESDYESGAGVPHYGDLPVRDYFRIYLKLRELLPTLQEELKNWQSLI